MKYTLYKYDKFIMQRKHFYPIKMYLIKSLGIKNIYIPYKNLMEIAKKIIIKWRQKDEIWSIRNGKRKQQKGFERKRGKEIKEQN